MCRYEGDIPVAEYRVGLSDGSDVLARGSLDADKARELLV
jgi:hypothetical protein